MLECVQCGDEEVLQDGLCSICIGIKAREELKKKKVICPDFAWDETCVLV